MTKPNDGRPAFPSQRKSGSTQGEEFLEAHFYGMSLREYYAGQALISLVKIENPRTSQSMEIIAELSLEYADALIKELNRET